jgi:hypothetical protein
MSAHKAKARIELLWPDGSITAGATWEDVEAAIRSEQWHSFDSLEDFRSEMCRRAGIWSGIAPNPDAANSQTLIQSLADAEMFMIHVEPEDQ